MTEVNYHAQEARVLAQLDSICDSADTLYETLGEWYTYDEATTEDPLAIILEDAKRAAQDFLGNLGRLEFDLDPPKELLKQRLSERNGCGKPSASNGPTK